MSKREVGRGGFRRPNGKASVVFSELEGERMVTRSRASSVTRSENADVEEPVQAVDVGISDTTDVNDETLKVPMDESFIKSPIAKVPKRALKSTHEVEPIVRARADVEVNQGGPSLTDEEIKKVIQQRTDEGNYIHLGFNSITGSKAVEWEAEWHEIQPSAWFVNLPLRMNEANMVFELNADNNLDMNYNYYTAMCGSAVRRVDEHLIAYISRARSDVVGNYRIEFRGSYNPGTSLSDCFASYYRGQMVENSLVSSDLQTTLGISRRMSQSLVPVITMGSNKSNNASFYAVGWLLYIHRLFFLTTEQVPVMVVIGEDQFTWADLNVEDNVQDGVSRRIMEAVAAQRLVILSENFTVGELSVLRLIANGLPRFSSPANSATVILLDDLRTSPIPMLVLGRGAAPVYPAAIPTALEISTTLTKLAKASYEGALCYAGLIRAAATAFRFRGRGDHRAYLDGFAQHRRTAWITPSFRNPLVVWFRLATNDENRPFDSDMSSFMGHNAEDQIRLLLVTCNAVAVCTSTILHRWSANSRIIQHYYNRTGDNEIGSAVGFLERRFIAGKEASCCTLTTLAALLLDDICEDNLPFEAFCIMIWNGSRINRIDPLDNLSAWTGGWARAIPYPVPPAAVLFLFKKYPTVWGYLQAPVTFTAGQEINSATSVRRAYVDITKGDDTLMTSILERDWFPSTGYTTCVLNAASQHCLVPRWDNVEIYIMSPTGMYDGIQPDLEYRPIMIYSEDARLFTVGTIWHYDWMHMAGIGIRWLRMNLPARVAFLFSTFTTHYLIASVNPPSTMSHQLTRVAGSAKMDKEVLEYKRK